MDDAHAAPAAAARGLDDDRVADLPGQLDGAFLVVVQRSVGPGDTGYPSLLHGLDGGDLVAHQADGLRAGADEDETAALHPLGKIRIFREEAIAGVDGDRVGDLGCADDGRDLQIALTGRRRADADRLVCEEDVLEVAVGGGVHRDRLDA
jgi:hypothetical protein